MKRNKEVSLWNLNQVNFIPKAMSNFIDVRKVPEPKHLAFGKLKGSIPIVSSGPKIKKGMNWLQAKTKYPKLSPFGDADKDGLMNMYDCKPFNKFLRDPEKPAKEPKNKKGIMPFPVKTKSPIAKTIKKHEKNIMTKSKEAEAEFRRWTNQAMKRKFGGIQAGDVIITPTGKIKKEEEGRDRQLFKSRNGTDDMKEIGKKLENINRRDIEDIKETLEEDKQFNRKFMLSQGIQMGKLTASQIENKKILEELRTKQAKLNRMTGRKKRGRSPIISAKQIGKVKGQVEELKKEVGASRKELKGAHKELNLQRDMYYKQMLKQQQRKPAIIRERRERMTLPSQIEFGGLRESITKYGRKVSPSKYFREIREEEREQARKDKELQEIMHGGQVVKKEGKEYAKPEYKREEYIKYGIIPPIMIDTPSAEKLIERMIPGEERAMGRTVYRGIPKRYQTKTKREIETEEREKLKRYVPEKTVKKTVDSIEDLPNYNKETDYYEVKKEKEKQAPIQGMINLIDRQEREKEKRMEKEAVKDEKQREKQSRRERRMERAKEKETRVVERAEARASTEEARLESSSAEELVENAYAEPETKSAQQLIDEV